MAQVKQPADKSHFILPDLGEGVHEAELIKWRVSAGDQVAEHQTLAEMETDKALVEVPSPWAGVVTELCGAEGDIINVGSVLVRYGESTGHPPASPASDQTQATESSASEEREDAGTVVGSMNNDGDAPSALTRRRTEAEEVPTEQARALATPAVRGIAKQLGVDINRVLGTGRGGRVTASDVERFAQEGTATEHPSNQPSRITVADIPEHTSASSNLPTDATAGREPILPPVPVDPSGTTEVIPFRGVRRKIAEALDRSVKTAVHFTVVDEADITDLDRKRKEYSAITGRKLSFLPFVIRAVAHGLREHPALNAVVDEAKSEIHRKGNLNLGIAVDSDAGLMVPVLRNAEKLAIVEAAEGVARLAAGCRDRSIPREELTGSSFTISNVGSYGGRFATPVINHPEVAILAVGRGYEKVLAKDGRIYAGLSLPMSLSCDHRVVDGAEGARFLNTVKRLLEDPTALLG
ncbi:MAG: dihydrolipoamide acetyltransferase family protein [Planctomycetota bacterium]